MRNARNFLRLAAILLSLAASGLIAEEAADIDQWIEQLGSDDFDTREKAVAELGKRAEKIWDRLEKLSKGENTDIRTLARRAMGEAGRRALKKMIDEKTADIAAREKAVEEASKALNPLYMAISAAEAAERDAIEKRIIDTNDTTKAAEAAAEKVKKEAVERWRNARDELHKKQNQWQKDKHALTSRVDQLKYLMDTNEIFLPSEVADWKPEKLPFDKKLKCSVSFEFVDKPLADALKEYKNMCGLVVELDKAVRDTPTINLRVTDMCADLSLEWVCKLVDLEYSIDAEGKKLIVHKPKQ